MSVAVKKPPSFYRPHALDGFQASKDFSLVDARAMMLLSQLAYETDEEKKVEDVLKAWGLTKLGFKTNNPSTGLPPDSACLVVAEGPRATFVTFAGSDPLKVQDWITDFDAIPSPDQLHNGFEKTVKNVFPDIQEALGKRVAPDQPVFFTGHSLGGALAIIAAWRTSLLPNAAKIMVYTFGSPRNGGPKFFNDYTPRLGNSTFRLVHGTDLVATVPPTLLGVYQHVGHAVQCPSGGVFEGVLPMARDENKPDFLKSLRQSAFDDVGALIALDIIPIFGGGLLEELEQFLPRMVRDHVPDSYFRALSIPLA